MLERKRCVPFRRAAYVGGGIKMHPVLAQAPVVYATIAIGRVVADQLMPIFHWNGPTAC